jgi:thiamine biosynthesis lipoprotein
LALGFGVSAQAIFKRTTKLMGSRFEITVVANDSVQANYYINAAVSEISRIEKLISSWDPNSQTAEINRYAGIKPVKVDSELFSLIERSIALSKLTDGAFDISFASIEQLWRFDGSMSHIPSEEKIKHSVSLIGYENIELNREDSTVLLRKVGVKIGFGAIGKGYAADKAKDLLVDQGVNAGIINASGDMTTWGTQPNGQEWKVAITNPLDKHKAFAILPVTNGAVVTSGDYEKFVILQGKRYSHIIDPRTGYPSSGIISVSVFAPKAELADALATSVFVMGVEVGLNRINQLPNVECVIIDDIGNIFTSRKIKIESL